MHGLTLETSLCYWRYQPVCFLNRLISGNSSNKVKFSRTTQGALQSISTPISTPNPNSNKHSIFINSKLHRRTLKITCHYQKPRFKFSLKALTLALWRFSTPIQILFSSINTNNFIFNFYFHVYRIWPRVSYVKHSYMVICK